MLVLVVVPQVVAAVDHVMLSVSATQDWSFALVGVGTVERFDGKW